MNTYRFVLLGAEANTLGAHIFCENTGAALELAGAMAGGDGPVEVWCGTESLGIIFSKKIVTRPIESVHPTMTDGQTFPFMEDGARQIQ
jgi:hypothetical protein